MGKILEKLVKFDMKAMKKAFKGFEEAGSQFSQTLDTFKSQNASLMNEINSAQQEIQNSYSYLNDLSNESKNF